MTTGTTIPLVTAQRHELERKRRQSDHTEVWEILDAVKDPEVPVLGIWELGVLQDVRVDEQSQILVVITPTYSGCPALAQMQRDVVDTLVSHGYSNVSVEIQLAPAWSTDWLTSEAKRKLRDYGIAAPGDPSCPQCRSTDCEVISEFGSTACKALYRCRDCGEPFDYFKPH